MLDDFVQAPPRPERVPHQLRSIPRRPDIFAFKSATALSPTGHEAAQATQRFLAVSVLLEQ